MPNVTISECHRAYSRIKAKMDVKQLENHLRHPLPLERFCDCLNTDRYAPGALKEATIPKDDGTERQLLIPSVFDRIAGRIALERLKPIITSLPLSAVGFRPRRGIQVALIETAIHLINNPGSTIFKFDIRDFFPSCDHRAALAILETLEPDPIAFDILSRQYTRWGAEHGGVPQGCVASPFLSNLVLRDIDQELEGMNIFYIRYADDGIIITQDEQYLLHAIRVLDDGLGARGLKLHDRKSHIVKDHWFEFLGIEVSQQGDLRIPKEAFGWRDKMTHYKQIRGWYAHYCFTWRWNQFLREGRGKKKITKTLTVVRGELDIVNISDPTKGAYQAHIGAPTARPIRPVGTF